MDCKELYDLLESLKTEEIKTMAFMSIRYMVKNRGENLKEILKYIKTLNKILDKKDINI